MGMVQIATAPNEINASLIKSVLENEGIQASYASNFGRYGNVASCTIYCIEDKKDEALQILKTKGLIKP